MWSLDHVRRESAEFGTVRAQTAGPDALRWRRARYAEVVAVVSKLSGLASLPELHTIPTLALKRQPSIPISLLTESSTVSTRLRMRSSTTVRSALMHRMTNCSPSIRAKVSPERTVASRPRPTARPTASVASRPSALLSASRPSSSTTNKPKGRGVAAGVVDGLLQPVHEDHAVGEPSHGVYQGAVCLVLELRGAREMWGDETGHELDDIAVDVAEVICLAAEDIEYPDGLTGVDERRHHDRTGGDHAARLAVDS